MVITKLIEQLNLIKDDVGDLEVSCSKMQDGQLVLFVGACSVITIRDEKNKQKNILVIGDRLPQIIQPGKEAIKFKTEDSDGKPAN
jgi:hypothetical protein